MSTTLTLPGLEHLISVLKAYGLGMDSHPPSPAALRANDLVLGEPFDPILASIYARLDGGRFGDFSLYRTEDLDGSLVQWNADLRRHAEERIQKLFRYGAMSGFAYYFATVPSLAARDGAQPVVFLDDYEIKIIYPLASNVDRAFDLYARYCEARLATYGALDGEPSIDQDDILFPFSFVEDIARDQELVRMIEGRRFVERFVIEPEEQQFIEDVLKAARTRA